MERYMCMKALSFDKVLPWAGQREALIKKEDGNYYVQIKAEHAQKVAFRILEEEYACKKIDSPLLRHNYSMEFHAQYLYNEVRL